MSAQKEMDMSGQSLSTTNALGLTGKQACLDAFFSSIHGHNFAVRFWDGATVYYNDPSPDFVIEFRKEPALLDMLDSPSLFFGEGYMRGEIDISGSFSSVARTLNDASLSGNDSVAGSMVRKMFSGMTSALRSVTQQKKDIAAHYDLGNDFFSLWLDKPTMSYSCAYFRQDEDSLETAQRQKIELILRKLHLEPGMRLLDIGCGWGGLSLGAASEYGAQVLAITLSEEQAAAVNRLFEDNGVKDRCEVRLCNYLELSPEERFDRVASVGMFEHVGEGHYDAYFAKVAELLREGGISLLHTLTKIKPGTTDPWITKYIFPGGRIPAVAEIIARLQHRDFPLLHVESLRRHYVRTLDVWHGNFSREDVLEKVRSKFGNEFIRMWSLYLRMAAASLDIGALDVHQFVFSKGPVNDAPMTLERVYA